MPNTFSATSLLKPVRQLVLGTRIQAEQNIIDIADLVSSRMGTAIHTAIEHAWLSESRNQALKLLGYDDKIIQRIKINPTKVKKNDIPVYMELRSFKEIEGYTISGKFDFAAQGKVHDFKSTSVWNYMNQTNAEKYSLQGSLYRLLNPEIITEDEMYIHYIFTDWNKGESKRNPNYPQARVLTQSIPLLSLTETEAFVKEKLALYSKYKNANERDIPPCTDKELWRKPTVWKYYKNPDSVKSTKNFDNPIEANVRYEQDGRIGIVKEVRGTVSACHYCPAFMICTQKDGLIASGDLVC